jgi:hypothetical protein
MEGEGAPRDTETLFSSSVKGEVQKGHGLGEVSHSTGCCWAYPADPRAEPSDLPRSPSCMMGGH